jgi:hypothetical protein
MFTEWAALYMTCVFDDEVLWLYVKAEVDWFW